jgi:raffinose/stachyose/melibiose transport system substrate-binding protein
MPAFPLPGFALIALLASAWTTAAQGATLTLESWRGDDQRAWESVLIPAFRKHHPGIAVRFAPTAPDAYDAALGARLANGSAGDLIACRPFAASLSLYRQGQLLKLDGKPGMDNFTPAAKVAWQTEDGKDSYCMPLASVIHGFLYNKKIFRELALQAPASEADFYRVLDTIKQHGAYQPLALDTAEHPESAQLLLASVGPNYWQGEAGRKALLAGSARFTDAPFVGALQYQARLGRYMPKDGSVRARGQSRQQFALGKAAIYPGGSWDLAHLRQTPGLELGAFAPPVPRSGDPCFICEHMEMGIGVNPRGKNQGAALAFLAWLGSAEFAQLYSSRMTGFFPLSKHRPLPKDPLARQMLGWHIPCASTDRVHTPWQVNARVINGMLAPAPAAAAMQAALAAAAPPAPRLSRQ